MNLSAPLNVSGLQGASMRFTLRPERGAVAEAGTGFGRSTTGHPAQHTALQLVKDAKNTSSARKSLPWQFVRVVHEDVEVAPCKNGSMEMGHIRGVNNHH